MPNGAVNYDYNYYLGDNLGNTRITFGTKTGAAVTYQQDDYYPFGMEINRSVSNPKNEYLYNKKELQEDFTEYDYGARYYDPVIAKWNTVDPLAEVSRRWSPYNYVENDPVRLTDPDGMITDDEWNERQQQTAADEQEGIEASKPPGSHDKHPFDEDDPPGTRQSAKADATATKPIKKKSAFASIPYALRVQIDKLDDELTKNATIELERNDPNYHAPRATGTIESADPTFAIILFVSTYGIGTAAEAGEGFNTFSEFKAVYGSAGDGMAWHHIVEQNPSNIETFGSEAIHTESNLVKIESGSGSLHAKISGYYSSKQPFTSGLTVRQWLSGQSFQQQYNFGIKIFKQFSKK